MQAEIVIPEWAKRIASDHTDMDRNPQPVDAGKVRSFRLTLPDDVYFEYAFIDAGGRMRADPGNELRARNPWYPEASAIQGPEYRPSRYSQLTDDTADGRLDRHRLDSSWLQGIRRVSVYTPRGQEGVALPLVLVHDGTAFLRVAGLDRVLEALLAEGRAGPARLAFIEPADRDSEYGFGDDYLRFTMDELLPFLDGHYEGTGERVALGASLGGLMSARLGLLSPDEVQTVVTFSGAFLGTPEDRDFYRSTRSWVLERVRQEPRLPLSWYCDVGTIEWLTDVNRELAAELAAKAQRNRYQERNAGHNWVNWRNGLADGLAFALERKDG
jgi:enterochelin esterase-like enzyme